MAPPEFLVALTKPWADFYGDSSVTSTLVTFAHLGGLLLAGGTAIVNDRATLAATPVPAARPSQLATLARAHRTVVGGLVVIATSGVLMLAADIETYYASWVYWLKMTLVVLLLANGWRMTRVEARLARAGAGSGAAPDWSALRTAAVISLALWFAITLAGVTLVNAG
jgi:hypothetical protein